jgi:hypothetical protein
MTSDSGNHNHCRYDRLQLDTPYIKAVRNDKYDEEILFRIFIMQEN